jgi:hypothetical protein
MSIPAAWTTFCEVDPFITLTEGRAAFRYEDLLALRRFLDALGKEADDAQ